MEVAMAAVEMSLCSSNTCTTFDDDIGNWANQPPVVDWNFFSCFDEDYDFRFIDSMVSTAAAANDGYVSSSAAGTLERSPSIEASTATSISSSPAEELVLAGDKEARLVHLLIAAAEAITGHQKSWELARAILVRLNELVPRNAVAGASCMVRVAAHFTNALQGILDGAGKIHDEAKFELLHGDTAAAFQLLQDMSPFMKFGHFTANQAILEAVVGERRVHIVDYDIMEGMQWASLMQSFVSVKDGTPPPHLRITAVTQGAVGRGRMSPAAVQETGRRLMAFAASVGQPMSFGYCRLDRNGKFRPAAVKAMKGEALVFNCVLHPQRGTDRSGGSVGSFLGGALELRSRLVTIVGEENGSGEEEEKGFVGRFAREMQRYSAMLDALEAGFPKQGTAREMVERVIFGPRIAGAVVRAYEEGEVQEGSPEWMTAAGFEGVGLSFFNHCQAMLLLLLYNEGYRVEENGSNKLILSWKLHRLISVSVWSAEPRLQLLSGLASHFSVK